MHENVAGAVMGAIRLCVDTKNAACCNIITGTMMNVLQSSSSGSSLARWQALHLSLVKPIDELLSSKHDSESLGLIFTPFFSMSAKMMVVGDRGQCSDKLSEELSIAVERSGGVSELKELSV